MRIKAAVDTLWRELEGFILEAYQSPNTISDHRFAIRDYAPNQTWTDALAQLLEAETVNEKQHRGSSRPLPKDLSASTAARLIICGNIASGAELPSMPMATIFLTYRKTAAEATLLGYLCAAHIPAEWRTRVKAYDYAELMKVSA